MSKLLVGLLFVGLNFYVYTYLATNEVRPERLEFAQFSEQIGDWRCLRKGEMDESILRNLGVTDYLMCDYVNESQTEVVNVYVGYHETQVRKEGGGAGENSIHPPEHCLPGSGWDVIDARVVPLDLPGIATRTGRAPEAKRFIIAKGDSRQLVYFWYQSRGHVIARNHEVILYRFFDRAIRHRTDGSLVRLTIPIERGNEQRAEAIFEEFASEFAPMLPGFVPN